MYKLKQSWLPRSPWPLSVLVPKPILIITWKNNTAYQMLAALSQMEIMEHDLILIKGSTSFHMDFCWKKWTYSILTADHWIFSKIMVSLFSSSAFKQFQMLQYPKHRASNGLIHPLYSKSLTSLQQTHDKTWEVNFFLARTSAFLLAAASLILQGFFPWGRLVLYA